MFELNLATLPNSTLYLQGVQLSYIKVYVHIFNLWHSDKPCFLSNPEFCKRTNLHKTTVIEAINFFEKHGLLKRVQKGKKRYLVQCTRFLEINEDVDKSEIKCSNDDHGSELAYPRVGASLPHGSELDDHNNKYNNKTKKSFCSSNDEKKKANEKKHPWVEENKKAPLADVTSQSNSYTAQPKASDKPSEILEEFMKKEKNAPKKTTKLSTRTAIQSKIPSRNEPDGQGAAIDAQGYQDNPSTVRGSDGLLEARGVYSFLEKTGLAG